MALPVLSKTWQFSVNNQTLALGSALATNRRNMRTLKNALIGFATNPWTVRQSSDSVAFGATGDGVDRWAADANLVWGTPGVIHSWIVLRQTGVSATFELIMELSATGSYQIVTFVTSRIGFSGGSLTARPTAADETVFTNSTCMANTDLSHRIHVWQSTDGQCTRFSICWSGTHGYVMVIDKPNNPTTGWTDPYVFFGAAPSTGFEATTGVNGRMNHAGVSRNLTMTSEAFGSLPLQNDNVACNIANEIDSAWDMIPIGIVCPTAGARGRHGALFDIWYINDARASGDMIPGDGSNQFACLMPFIMPWNGTAAPAFS